MSLFLTIVLSVWAAMHSYVFWRLSTIPWISSHFSRRTILFAAVCLWLSYPLARFLEGHVPGWLAVTLEYLAANWVGFLFLQVCAFLAADVLTLGGVVFRAHGGEIRGVAAAFAFAMGIVALAQGHREPAVTSFDVELAGLPRERDGTVLVAISDLHLGTLIGRPWLERLVDQVNALQPDIIVAVGDLVDGNADRVRELPPVFRNLHAPLGVWAVTGNHEYYAGLAKCVTFFEASGMRVLRDQSAEVTPGLVLAGVDDLTARRQFGDRASPIATALSDRPEGATILLSHTPWLVSEAASAGAGLMISGHTHKGQIWPFSYLVEGRYPYLNGVYTSGSMKVAVGRGAGTWGPRMRLWQTGEILRITLRSQKRDVAPSTGAD